MNILAGKYNFTWESHQSLDGKWGTRPISGPANKSGIWGGVFGSVVNGNYDISLSMWSWIKERFEILDFVELVSSSYVLVLTPQSPEIDLGNIKNDVTHIMIISTLFLPIKQLCFMPFTLTKQIQLPLPCPLLCDAIYE